MRAGVLNILISTLLGTQLLQFPPPAFAQASIIDYVYLACNTAIFANGDSFSQNLNAVAESLKKDSSRVLYSLASSETGTSSDYVHAMYQCSGDIALSDCSTCVIYAFTAFDRSLCGILSKGVRVQYRGCYVRYEGFVFSTGLDTVLTHTTCSSSAINRESSQVYWHNLGTALQESAAAVPQHPLFGYNATSVGSGSNTVYALTQCVGYLNSTQCATCLSQASNYSDICNRSVLGQVYYVDCYYLFGNT